METTDNINIFGMKYPAIESAQLVLFIEDKNAGHTLSLYHHAVLSL